MIDVPPHIHRCERPLIKAFKSSYVYQTIPYINWSLLEREHFARVFFPGTIESMNM